MKLLQFGSFFLLLLLGAVQSTEISLDSVEPEKAVILFENNAEASVPSNNGAERPVSDSEESKDSYSSDHDVSYSDSDGLPDLISEPVPEIPEEDHRSIIRKIEVWTNPNMIVSLILDSSWNHDVVFAGLLRLWQLKRPIEFSATIEMIKSYPPGDEYWSDLLVIIICEHGDKPNIYVESVLKCLSSEKILEGIINNVYHMPSVAVLRMIFQYCLPCSSSSLIYGWRKYTIQRQQRCPSTNYRQQIKILKHWNKLAQEMEYNPYYPQLRNCPGPMATVVGHVSATGLWYLSKVLPFKGPRRKTHVTSDDTLSISNLGLVSMKDGQLTFKRATTPFGRGILFLIDKLSGTVSKVKISPYAALDFPRVDSGCVIVFADINALKNIKKLDVLGFFMCTDDESFQEDAKTFLKAIAAKRKGHQPLNVLIGYVI